MPSETGLLAGPLGVSRADVTHLELKEAVLYRQSFPTSCVGQYKILKDSFSCAELNRLAVSRCPYHHAVERW